ncbi:MAG: LysR substrate-binding domain-containing protein [Bacilli bacterium]|jgi:DNA-binding transcriptional LysR family regulator|nr:LysR family transcriptional regulator [Bacillota bacterium]NLI52092.1 LysR family transcriptional regulator [Erysipelotrichaceae bacterium]HOE53789.1 LysR family transcriptional regulator [Bacilli bacterium]TAH59083.1 MAG: LysR family transcriptional regulator [Bacillota bacterium]HOM32355.1 LysR family transcriptional regulator [Bacilli bacterium]
MIDDKLKTLIILAKVKNYTQTAELCNLSQPAVTQHIKALESRYGIEIFRRNGRNLTLTYEGKSLVDSAKKLIALERNIQKEIKKQKGQPKKLDIGITLTAGGYFIPEIMEVFKDKYPNLRFNFHTDIAENILERMRLNELDFAIIDGTSQTDEFNIELLFRDELIIIGPKDHRLADKKNVSIEELKKEKFILRHEKANTRLAFENYLSNHFDNINNFDVILEIDNTAMIKQLIIAGHGLSVMSKAICEINMQVGTLKQIDLRDFHLERGIYLVYPKELENSEIIDSILALKE